MNTCSKCRSTMESGTSDLNFNRNELRIHVKNVPAFICPNCGYKTMEGKLALYVNRIVQAIFDSEQPIRMREVTLEAA